MEAPIYLRREYRGTHNPHETPVPTAHELFELCTEKHPRHYNLGLPYPPEKPVFWIKYGTSIIWNELFAQSMAYKELKRLDSKVRAPAVFYACELRIPTGCHSYNYCYKAYIVMEYMPGKTAGQMLQDAETPESQDEVYSRVAFALSELQRIPIPQDAIPAGIHGRNIRHTLFDEQEAPRQYDSVAQLEQHLNEFLSLAKRKSRIKDLAREPLTFCYSDIWLENFMINGDDTIVVDFADASILPSSFSKFALAETASKIKRDISHLVTIPTTDGVDNTMALFDVQPPLVMGPSSFATSGRRLFGDEKRHDSHYLSQILTDGQGNPVTVFIPDKKDTGIDLPPPPPPGPWTLMSMRGPGESFGGIKQLDGKSVGSGMHNQ